MSDHSLETFHLQSRRGDEKYARNRLLGGDDLILDKDTIPWILNHIDCFVSQSRGNKNIIGLNLFPYSLDGHDDDGGWDKFGQAIGNLQSLERLRNFTRDRTYGNYDDGDDEDDYEVLPNPDWGERELACILSRVRQKVRVEIGAESDLWAVGEVQALARAIHGHPMITSFDSGGCNFLYENLDSLYSALATLPALESMRLSSSGLLVTESTMANPESLTKQLRVPTLQAVSFCDFYFTSALCQATANALMEGTAITNLTFIECSFPAEEECAAIMATGLSRNTSVISIIVRCRNARLFFDALAAAIPSNPTLRHLVLRGNDDSDSDCLSAFLLASGRNKGLETLSVNGGKSMDESLCTAIKDGLGMNETLESLELNYVHLTDDDLWCRAFSFLRTNKALKSLVVHTSLGATESCVSAFRIGIVAMLQENASLESIYIRNSYSSYTIKAEEYSKYIALITALQHNATLKTIKFYNCGILRFTDDEEKQMAAPLKKNYRLESLPDFNLENEAGDVGAILRLNGAGRRYLVDDGSSISKGVKVLSAVSDDINCVFLHLQENPRLCDRSAVEMGISAGVVSSRSTSPTASSAGGKREQASVPKGRESRRRLA
jgi:hypothetical protein